MCAQSSKPINNLPPMRTEHCKPNRLFGPIMQVISYTAGVSCTNWMSAFFLDIVVISLFSCLLIIIMAAIVCVNHHSRQIMNESTTPMLAKAKKCQSIQWETIFCRNPSVMLNQAFFSTFSRKLNGEKNSIFAISEKTQGHFWNKTQSWGSFYLMNKENKLKSLSKN